MQSRKRRCVDSRFLRRYREAVGERAVYLVVVARLGNSRVSYVNFSSRIVEFSHSLVLNIKVVNYYAFSAKNGTLILKNTLRDLNFLIFHISSCTY